MPFTHYITHNAQNAKQPLASSRDEKQATEVCLLSFCVISHAQIVSHSNLTTLISIHTATSEHRNGFIHTVALYVQFLQSNIVIH